MRKRIVLLLAAICLLAAGTALAQVEAGEQVIYQKVTVLDIQEPMQVPGELVGPSSSYLPVKRGADFVLLVPVRDNFLPEMMQTAGSL